MSGFQTPLDLRAYQPGEWLLLSPLEYRSDSHGHGFTVPKNFITDLASIPRVLRGVFDQNGVSRPAAVLHDYLYCARLTTRAEADGLFLDCCRRVAAEHPAVKYDELIVDNTCMQLVLDPTRFDVLLLENLYGDIVSDLCAGFIGGLGMAPGANIGEQAAVFEAVHGSAPDIAGKNLANPIALVLSAAMMLDHLGERSAHDAILRAIEQVIGDERVKTPDLGGRATTADMTRAVAAALTT